MTKCWSSYRCLNFTQEFAECFRSVRARRELFNRPQNILVQVDHVVRLILRVTQAR